MVFVLLNIISDVEIEKNAMKGINRYGSVTYESVINASSDPNNNKLGIKNNIESACLKLFRAVKNNPIVTGNIITSKNES